VALVHEIALNPDFALSPQQANTPLAELHGKRPIRLHLIFGFRSSQKDDASRLLEQPQKRPRFDAAQLRNGVGAARRTQAGQSPSSAWTKTIAKV
jgi:hypothetical protein